jgi:hypothetical protein
VSRVIPEIELVPNPKSEEGRGVLGHKWAAPEIGHRHKIGGVPQWLRSEAWPDCCGSRMTFYAQLDSVGDEIHLADCGLIYVFVCFDCFSTKSVFQCA